MKKNIGTYMSLMLLCALAMTFPFAAGCSRKHTNKGAPENETYKIGAIFSVTGSGAPIGTSEKEAAELLVGNINKEGGINGRKIALIVEDDASDPAKALVSANKLLEKDKVLAVIGPSLTGATLEVVNRFEEEKTPLISCAAGIRITEPVKPYVFQMSFNDRNSIGKILSYLVKSGIKKIAFINDSDAFGTSGRREMENQAPPLGVEIAAKESFSSADTDMTDQLTRIKGTDAQAVVCWGTNPGPAFVTRGMKKLGLKIPLIQSPAVANNKFADLAGYAADGVVMPAGRILVFDQLPDGDPQKQTLKKFSTAFEAAYGRPADHFAGHVFDAVEILAAAIKKAGGDREKIRWEIENTKNLVGVDGIHNYSTRDHNGLTQDAFVMVEMDKGKWKLLNGK